MPIKTRISRTFKDGLFLIMPIGLTLGVLSWFWSTINKFIPDVTIFLPEQWMSFPHIQLIANLCTILVIVILIIFIGMIASTVFGRFLNFFIEQILAAPTFIRPIYSTFKKITEGLFHQENSDGMNMNLSQNIIIPFPHKDSQAIGFITSYDSSALLGEEGKDWLTIYLPSAPIISSGFTLLVPKKSTYACKLNGSDALTTVISAGTTVSKDSNTFTTPTKKQENFFRVWFINGILFLTPLIGTGFVLSWIFSYLHTFFMGVTSMMPLALYEIIPAQYFELVISASLILIIICIVMIVGFIGESTFGLWFKSMTNKFFNIIPMYNLIYDIAEQITKMFSSDPSKGQSFDQAVLIPFPSETTYAVGFVTGKDSSSIKSSEGEDFIPVFIPTTPIPTTGWFTMVHHSQIKALDMSVDKAFAFVISGGILADK